MNFVLIGELKLTLLMRRPGHVVLRSQSVLSGVELA